MSRTRWALILLASIGALLALLLLLIPRRPAPEAGRRGKGAGTLEAPYPVPEKEPLPPG